MAGILASFASITYPAISALVSKNAEPEQQGLCVCVVCEVYVYVHGVRVCNSGVCVCIHVRYVFMYSVCASETLSRAYSVRVASMLAETHTADDCNVTP